MCRSEGGFIDVEGEVVVKTRFEQDRRSYREAVSDGH